ncbi:MAG: hypothetical protein WBB55_02525 [Anaerolineales bacterium]
MDAYEPKELPERNPVTYERHRKEVMWQILVPVLIGAVIVLALAILAATRTDAQVSKGADVSVIWMITPMLIIALIFLVLLGAMIYAVMSLLGILPSYARLVQDYFDALRVQVGIVSDKAVEPILRMESIKASLHALGRSLRQK